MIYVIVLKTRALSESTVDDGINFASCFLSCGVQSMLGVSGSGHIWDASLVVFIFLIAKDLPYVGFHCSPRAVLH